MEIPRDIDKIIASVKNQFPEVNIEQLKGKFPADDDGIWFFSIAENVDDELQIESSFGQCPFLIETNRNDERRNGKTVNQVVSIICEHLKTLKSNEQKNLAICLVSGGMDSCVTSAIAKSENDEIAFLHISYGQLTEQRERKAFNDIADFYEIEKQLDVSIEYFAKIGGSSLTDKNIEVSETDLDSEEIPTSYVPFRNANMLAIATSWAEVLNAKAIYIGAVAEDSSGYPDCRPEFFEAFEKTIETGTKPDTNIKIKTPIIHLTKAEIVKKGFELNAPIHLSWSCYRSEDLACGTCDSCALRLRGFEQAGLEDPIAYVK